MAGRAALPALALALLTGCGAGGPTPMARPSDLEALLPQTAELAGWSIAEGPVEYAPETLYEYLDGGADRYLSHGFRRLLHVRYQLAEDPLAAVTLDLYDMGDELGAFGIYSAGRRPGMEIRPWGAEGYRTGVVAAAYRGRIFVHGAADDERPELMGMLERLVAAAGARAEGGTSPPAILDPLPADGLVAGSEGYVAADLLGHSFLPGGVLATYEVEGRRAELYVSDLGGGAAASSALGALRDHLAREGVVDSDGVAIGRDGYRYRDPVLGQGTAVRAGHFVAGIHGDLPPETREAILARLVASLPAQ